MKALLIILLLLIAACAEKNSLENEIIIEYDESGNEQITVIEPTEIIEEGVEIPSDTVPIDKAKSSFGFEGYGVAGAHGGTFTSMDGTLELEENRVVGADGVIDASSVTTGIRGLDDHLRNEDFFDVANHPAISFHATMIDHENSVMVGTLTLRGTSREIAIPVLLGERSVSGTFLLAMSPFGINYTGVEDQVLIQFVVTG